MIDNGLPFAQQVVLARFLFREGERALEVGSAMSAGLAVSLFQDAAELMIWAVAKFVDVNLKDQAPFDSFWDAILKAPKNTAQLELPSRTSMRELNKARVNFKHYGQIPVSEDAKRFRGATDAFLRETAERFLKIDIDSYSLADLISNQAAREKIKEAEKFFKEERWQECVQACALADEAVAAEFETIVAEPDDKIEELADLVGNRERHDDARSGFRYLRAYLNGLRGVAVQLLAGRNLKQYSRFKSIAPRVIRFRGGRVEFAYAGWRGARPMGETDAEFCLNYVTDFALQAQDRLAG